jgi:hypothetical protein
MLRLLQVRGGFREAALNLWSGRLDRLDDLSVVCNVMLIGKETVVELVETAGCNNRR